MKKEAFPLEVKAGGVRVKIYNVSTPARERYTLAYHDAGGRKLRQFADLAEARREAKETAEKLNDGRGSALELSGADRDHYLAAISKLKELKPLDISLATAIAEYVDAKRWNVPLGQAAKSYAETHNAKVKDKKISEIVTELLEAKKADGCSALYLKDARSRLTRFASDFNDDIANVQKADLDAWLRRLKVAPLTRNNFRRLIIVLFRFARAAGYLPEDRKTVAEGTAKAKQDELDIEVFTPVEYAKLLTAADDDLLPFLIFGGMAGLRSAEVQRLQWEQVNWPESFIKIEGKVAKTGKKRNVPLMPAAAVWLASFKNARGAVVPKISLYFRLKALSKAAGIAWKQNALRHGFCSYRLATLKNVAQVAYEAGNSPTIIETHYDKHVTESEGKAWFSIMPKTAENVLPMVATA